ncbi:MAG: hypothetical protein B6D72_01080 [gamma proteobacterium symbiont of Ctena orbiculata]|uniref:Uncharacterized protein n=1 Tax=Candidatus Thiodiazotropha taylori TaxID=2792791 RepID=A0A944MC09_9GAMM|nr:hypothetical protein [Candidatus Thiodiazotropha taylori]PUB88131.1 MAG: hypothetical protein DBP00_06795 [gamma proteobacterium symbiont of Ctena orbiculata]MBT2990622.1 hypothetical protein [Candidatus Thiodiazotropha taylori]MBT2998869.1 hypothetical protein [Candidatus Thiodiazotropha taylori]MBT3002817.1 hypothetical protein [Candidatus Thiodiazotropha taylori]
MQISNSLTLPSLTLSLEQQRESAARMAHVLPLASQIGEAAQTQTLRGVEQVKQAEQLLQRQRSRPSFSQASDDPRKQRALSSYQAVQASQERDYVSEVLGIDVYA